jgi:serine/threonine protein kinase
MKFLRNFLGEGNFSNVFLCVRWVKRYIGAADGTITDIMRYHFDVKVLKLYKRNFNFMNSLKLVKDNPKISKYFPQITEIYPNKNMYEMEYTYGVTLENLVTSATKIHPSLLSKIFSDLEAAITDLLNQGFFVCDINPGNIIIDFVSGKVHFLDVDETAFYYAHKSVMNVNIKYSTESMLNTFKMSANDYEEILHKIKSEMDIITDKFSKIDTVEDLQAHLLPQSQYLQFYDLLITSSSTLQEDITFKAPEAAVYAVAYQSENGTNTLFTMVHDDNVSLGRQFKFAILDLITEDELFTEAYGYGEIVFQSIKGRQLIHKLWEDEPRLIVEDNNDELEEKRQQRLYSKFRAKPDNSSEEEANTKSDDSSSDELAYLVNLEKTKFDSLLSKLGSTFDKEERQLIIKLNNAHHVGLVLQATGYSQKDVEQAMYKAQNYFEIAQSILRGEPIQSEYHIKRGSILIISDDNLGKPNQPVSDSEEI